MFKRPRIANQHMKKFFFWKDFVAVHHFFHLLHYFLMWASQKWLHNKVINALLIDLHGGDFGFLPDGGWFMKVKSLPSKESGKFFPIKVATNQIKGLADGSAHQGTSSYSSYTSPYFNYFTQQVRESQKLFQYNLKMHLRLIWRLFLGHFRVNMNSHFTLLGVFSTKTPKTCPWGSS